MCEDLAPNLTTKELAVASRQRTVSHIIFNHGIFFARNSITVVLHPPYFSMFARLKIELKGRLSDAIEVIEAESQAVLNSLTEQDFQDGF
jgi:hypothetical protein